MSEGVEVPVAEAPIFVGGEGAYSIGRAERVRRFFGIYVMLGIISFGALFAFAKMATDGVRTVTVENVIEKPVGVSTYDELVKALGPPAESPDPETLGATGMTTCGVWTPGKAPNVVQIVACKP